MSAKKLETLECNQCQDDYQYNPKNWMAMDALGGVCQDCFKDYLDRRKEIGLPELTKDQLGSQQI